MPACCAARGRPDPQNRRFPVGQTIMHKKSRCARYAGQFFCVPGSADLVRSTSSMAGPLREFRAQSISANTNGSRSARPAITESAVGGARHSQIAQPSLPADVSHAFTLKGWELCEAILGGWKDIENRHVRMEGWVAVHLGRDRADSDQLKLLRTVIPELPVSSTLALGTIVGAVFFERCVRLAELRQSCGCGVGCDMAVGGKHDAGCRLNPFAHGPVCNVISASVRFAHPIPCPGAVGRWEIPPDLRVAVQHVLSQPWALLVRYNRLSKHQELPRHSPLPWLTLGPPDRPGPNMPPERTTCSTCGSASTSLLDRLGRPRWVKGMCKRCYAAAWRHEQPKTRSKLKARKRKLRASRSKAKTSLPKARETSCR